MQRILNSGCQKKYMRTFVTFILTLLLGFASCKKDNQQQCEELKNAAYSNDVAKVGSIITTYITSLASQNYNEQNIEMLSERIRKCDISASVFCFDCIQTLPSQTEIGLNFLYNGSMVQKVVDLSYSGENKIVFRNLHD